MAPEDVDDRDTDWLARALYRAHHQTVRLVFEDGPAQGEPTSPPGDPQRRGPLRGRSGTTTGTSVRKLIGPCRGLR